MSPAKATLSLETPILSPRQGGGEWRKARLAFTTQGYDKISISINSDLASVQLDDVSLYERYTITKENLDTSAVDKALKLVP